MNIGIIFLLVILSLSLNYYKYANVKSCKDINSFFCKRAKLNRKISKLIILAHLILQSQHHNLVHLQYLLNIQHMQFYNHNQ